MGTPGNLFVSVKAVLADEDENWRPRGFGYKVFGSEVSIIFPMVKIIDYEDRMDELEKNINQCSRKIIFWKVILIISIFLPVYVFLFHDIFSDIS